MIDKNNDFTCLLDARSGSGMTSARGESGRSMVEMLGTLAIIGVLSVGSIAGYTYAMNKYYTNELLAGASARAVVVASQLASGRAPSLSEFSKMETAGGKFDGTVVEFTDGFGIKVTGVKKAVCENLIASIEDTDIGIETEGGGEVTCGDENEFYMTFEGIGAGEETVDDPCHGRGTWVEDLDTCICNYGHGRDCLSEEELECENGNYNTSTKKCDCYPETYGGYWGERCENFHWCNGMGGSFDPINIKCICNKNAENGHTGYFGATCEDYIYCVNGLYNASTDQCDCDAGYSGATCEEALCKNGTYNTSTNQCDCYGGYIGAACEEALCKNGTYNTSTGQCDCPDGFDGERCDVISCFVKEEVDISGISLKSVAV